MNCDIKEMIIVFNIYHLIGASLCHKGEWNGMEIKWNPVGLSLFYITILQMVTHQSCQSSSANFSRPLHFCLKI